MKASVFDGSNWLHRLRAWWWGFQDGLGACGITWEEYHNPHNWRLNQAYDHGRALRQRIGR